MNSTILYGSDLVAVEGLRAYLSDQGYGNTNSVNSYRDLLSSAKFLEELNTPFILIVEGKILDCSQLQQLTSLYTQAKFVVFDSFADYDSLLLALNFNSSYISLGNNPQTLLQAIRCALSDAAYICPQSKVKLGECVFQGQRKSRQALQQLSPVDRIILYQSSRGLTQEQIGKLISYTPVNVGCRLRGIAQKLGLQDKQEAISLAIDLGLKAPELESVPMAA